MGMVCCLVLGCIVITIIVLPIRSALIGWDARGSWGSMLDRREQVGEGPFRASTTENRRPRGVPWSVWAAGVPGAALAPFTGLMLAPAGLFGGMILTDDAPVVGTITVLAAIDGLILPFALYGASRDLLRCDVSVRWTAARTGLWSLVHHGVLALTFAAYLLVDPDWFLALGLALIGLVHATVMLVACRQVSRIQDEIAARAALEDPAPLSG